MGKTIPRQHGAVVLRSHGTHLRALLIAVIAVVGLTAAVMILPTNEDRDTSAGSAPQVSAADGPRRIHSPGQRYDGGPEAGTRGAVPSQAPSTRYDGGPEEGTSGAQSSGAPSNAVPGTRYDGGPEEGSRGFGH
jgi:hypothetical protein